jgi:hypothetical protein
MYHAIVQLYCIEAGGEWEAKKEREERKGIVNRISV